MNTNRKKAKNTSIETTKKQQTAYANTKTQAINRNHKHKQKT